MDKEKQKWVRAKYKPSRLEIRISTEEKLEFQQIAESHNMTLSDYILSSTRGNRISEPAELKKIYVQLKRISNLNNQIAKYTNTYCSNADAKLVSDKLESVKDELIKCQKSIGNIYDK